MIDLSRLRTLLEEVEDLIEQLDGVHLMDHEAWSNKPKGEYRDWRAQRSQELQLLATRLELGANLVRIEFWHAKGHDDPLNPDRKD